MNHFPRKRIQKGKVRKNFNLWPPMIDYVGVLVSILPSLLRHGPCAENETKDNYVNVKESADML